LRLSSDFLVSSLCLSKCNLCRYTSVGEIEYKLVVASGKSGDFEWEKFQGGNRVVNLLPGGSFLKIAGEFEQELKVTKEAPPQPKPPKPTTPVPPLQAPDFPVGLYKSNPPDP
jgi:hypothetical protein